MYLSHLVAPTERICTVIERRWNMFALKGILVIVDEDGPVDDRPALVDTTDTTDEKKGCVAPAGCDHS